MKKFCFIFILFTMIAITMACSSNGTEEPVDNARYIEEPVKFILHIKKNNNPSSTQNLIGGLHITDDSAIKDFTELEPGYYGFTLVKYGTTIINVMPLYSMYYPAYPMKITYEKDADGNISYSAECKAIEFELMKDDYLATDVFPIEVRICDYINCEPPVVIEPGDDISGASMPEILSTGFDNDGYYVDLMIRGPFKGEIKSRASKVMSAIILDARNPRYSMEKPLRVLNARKTLRKTTDGTYVVFWNATF